jgi:hypothetical protein
MQRFASLCLLLLIILILGMSGISFSRSNDAARAAPDMKTFYLPVVTVSTPPGPTELILLAPGELPADNGRFVPITARILDNSGNPVGDYPVTFITTAGRFANGTISTSNIMTDATGTATVKLYGEPQLSLSNRLYAMPKDMEDLEQSDTIDLVASDCNDIEENDLSNQASIQPSAICDASLEGDQNNEYPSDYYAIIVSSDQRINLRLTNIPSGADYDLALYDSVNGFVPTEPVAYSNQNDESVETINFQVPDGAPNEFIVRVYGARYSTTEENTYRLQVELDPLEQPGGAEQPEWTDPGDITLLSDISETNPPMPPKP